MSALDDVDRALAQAVEQHGLPNPSSSLGRPRIQFETASLARHLDLFKIIRGKRSIRDVVTQSVLLVPQGNVAWLYATDGIAHLRAKIPATIENFTDSKVFNLDSLLTAVAWGNEHTTLLLDEEGHLWAEFFEGRVYVQTYGFPQELFRGRIPKSGKSEIEASTSKYADAIRSLAKVANKSDIPALNHVFLTPQGAYASSGSLVSKVEGEFHECTLRHRDCGLLLGLLEHHEGTTFKIKPYEDQVMLSTTFFDYVFPVVSKNFPQTYQERIGVGSPLNSFKISSRATKKLLSLLRGIPENTGVLALHFGPRLGGEIRTRKGHVSNFEVPGGLIGSATEAKVQTQLKIFSMALGVFEEDEIQLGVGAGGALVLWSDTRTVSFMTRPGV